MYFYEPKIDLNHEKFCTNNWFDFVIVFNNRFCFKVEDCHPDREYSFADFIYNWGCLFVMVKLS
jgi:hypothetical protein